VDRAVLLSHSIFHKKNHEFVINLLLDNGFSLNVIFNKINLRLKKLFNTKLKSNNTLEPDNDESVEHVEKKIRIYSVYKECLGSSCVCIEQK